MFSQKRIYLDYAASTPIDRRVRKVVRKYEKVFANPSSIHKEGVEAQKEIKESKINIARMLGVKSNEVFFTATGTESDNLAIKGVLKSAHLEEPHIITSTIEHPAILEACRDLESEGQASVTYIKPNKDGIIDPSDVRKNITPNTVLISIMQVNNEIGTTQPISKISRLVKKYRQEANSKYPYIHTDASQAPCYLSVELESLGVDLLTLDGLKIYGPKGIGLLAKKDHVEISPIILGGGQEMGLRSGTENIPAIKGLEKALEIAVSERESESRRLLESRDYLIDNILDLYPEASLNGSKEARVVNNVNVCFPREDAEFLVIKLDNLGFATSFSSSCRSKAQNSNSYVIEEIGKKDCATSSLRITLGRFTKMRHIKRFLRALSQSSKIID